MAPKVASIWVTSGMVSEDGFNWNPLKITLIQFTPSAYLSRNYNVLAVDWYRLTQYPCYIPALANTKLVAQCTAQVRTNLLDWGPNKLSLFISDVRLFNSQGFPPQENHMRRSFAGGTYMRNDGKSFVNEAAQNYRFV